MISGQFDDHKWIPKFDKNIIHLPFPYPWVLEKMKIDGKTLFQKHLKFLKRKINLKEISSFFFESFQGWGAIFYPKEFLILRFYRLSEIREKGSHRFHQLMP